MSRRHADPVEVRGTGDRPTHFLWRDRVYAVREVLGHWKESGPWWEEARRPARRAGQPPAGASPSAVLAHCARTEREIWRVEASPGRAFAVGVYDLTLDPGADRWTLTRTAD